MIPENATLFSIFLLGKGIHEKTPCDVTACRREYLRTAPSSEERLLIDWDHLGARMPLEFYPQCELHSGALNDSLCNSSSTEAGVLIVITELDPKPPEGGTYYHWWEVTRPSLLLYPQGKREPFNGASEVIQRRGNFNRSKHFFYKDWSNYKSGFGDIEKDFWLGNDNIFALSNQRLCSIRFDLKAVDGEERYALYDTFWIDDELNNYTLHIKDYSGTAGSDSDYYYLHFGVVYVLIDIPIPKGNAAMFEGSAVPNVAHLSIPIIAHLDILIIAHLGIPIIAHSSFLIIAHFGIPIIAHLGIPIIAHLSILIIAHLGILIIAPLGIPIIVHLSILIIAHLGILIIAPLGIPIIVHLSFPIIAHLGIPIIALAILGALY
ncbi:Techylectin-5A [Araneus ventricosus]|uniref:Techylectin-5A n=1 Tax=Araneus ventricosus TaxID=182803 RepID=A0A4Y2TDL6_ARAVE|nr:Techylectin-5A [Araneus ventricosus]